DCGPAQRVVVVEHCDRPERCARRYDVGRGELALQGWRRSRSILRWPRGVRPSLRRVLRRECGHQPREQPCYKGEQGCSFRTADRRPPHPGPPGTRRATPPCPPPPPPPPPAPPSRPPCPAPTPPAPPPPPPPPP